ncbi:exodeoxyribonuclease VII large subunit [Phycisphaera mikurensis NBRC 102666]|uniref:Exodeoxyribonuclease 7 large subunit n=1 Tax=Phycisphaera mikurensis (strain NBRC 102666 / KCTC 22515 / FYK2301M01) TaxID=1142394 RepID=I0IFN6_PHYMF|nr:exodeoxyribonuclease VII large subunit [Phycisphaera mikurensis NBRC 102666]
MAADAPWPVSRLAAGIQAALQEGLPRKLRVVGEISNLSARNHWFFSLKDGDASIRAVMFASAARRVAFEARDGLSVIATGRVDYYAAQGSVQLYVDALQAVGEGELEAAFRRLALELREEGLFAAERKKPLPAYPRSVAVVTSRSAAALQDVRDTARRRWPGCRLVLVDVRVQGPSAAPQVAAALARLSAEGAALGIDAVLLTRGGGSIEDLWAFNEPDVVRAVAACSLPTVAAIGHETDTTLAELAADARCATPTQAAMTLVPDERRLREQAVQLERRLTLAAGRRVEAARARVEAAARHRLFTEPARLVADARDRVAAAERRLHAAVPRRLAAARDRLLAAERTLAAVGPQRVLARGYTYTTDGSGRPLKTAEAAAGSAKLVTRFADGEVRSVPERRARPRPPRRRGPDPDTGGLFCS